MNKFMEKSQVYFIKLDELDKIKKLLPEFKEPLGIKVHFGEEGNVTYLPAEYIKTIISRLKKPVLIETSVLYKSPRRTAAGHKRVALKHGFNFAPIDFLDGAEGDDSEAIKINGRHFKTCFF